MAGVGMLHDSAVVGKKLGHYEIQELLERERRKFKWGCRGSGVNRSLNSSRHTMRFNVDLRSGMTLEQRLVGAVKNELGGIGRPQDCPPVRVPRRPAATRQFRRR